MDTGQRATDAACASHPNLSVPNNPEAPEIIRLLDMLGEKIDLLGSVTSDLGNRLMPILKQGPDRPGVSDHVESFTILGERLSAMCSQMDLHNERLADYTMRAEV